VIGRAGACGLALLCLAATGCAARRGHSPSLAADIERLEESLDVLPAFPEPPAAKGSLWTDAGPGAALVRDTRAYRVNDLLRIRVQESSLGANESSTALDRSSQASFGAPVAFGLEDPNAAPGEFNLASVLSVDSESKFSGDGATSRSSRVVGYITARVMRVLPNGDLIIAGQKNVMVNRDRQILTLVGSVRPVDVSAANEISSAGVGDLTVRLWGQGEVDDTVRQGWFMRIMNRIWPF
jgi:flagellar L-ring protein precursor FlgH